MDATETLASANDPNAALDAAVRQLKFDRDRLLDDSRTLAVEAARALGRTALSEILRRPFTTAAVVLAAASTTLAAAMSRREAARTRRAAGRQQ